MGTTRPETFLTAGPAGRLKCMKRAPIAGIFAVLAVNTVFGQAEPGKLEFEAVSIKTAPPGARGGGYNLSPGRLNAKNQSLRDLVKFAFDLQDYQVSWRSGWLDTDRYEMFCDLSGRNHDRRARPNDAVDARGPVCPGCPSGVERGRGICAGGEQEWSEVPRSGAGRAQHDVGDGAPRLANER